MSVPVVSAAELFAASAKDVEDQVRKDTVGLDPATVERILGLTLRYGPSVYAILMKLYHIAPKG